MENDIWILDVNIIYHVGCFAVPASSPCSAEAVISKANEWWVQHGLTQIYLLHLSPVFLRTAVNWLSLELGTAASLARVVGQALSCVRWPQPMGGSGSAGWELSHPVLAFPANPHPEMPGSKAKPVEMRREKLPSWSSVSQVWWAKG